MTCLHKNLPYNNESVGVQGLYLDAVHTPITPSARHMTVASIWMNEGNAVIFVQKRGPDKVDNSVVKYAPKSPLKRKPGSV